MFLANSSELQTAILDCYLLPPVSTFILPCFSERVVQNEYTPFTFLSAEGLSTLRVFIESYDDNHFELIIPDAIYYNFEMLFKKEAYGREIHNNYVLISTILSALPSQSLEVKIVKTLLLIYVLAQFGCLKPTKDEIFGVYSASYPIHDINSAINNLIEKEFVVYLKSEAITIFISSKLLELIFKAK